jgi:hypothetical protein
MALTRPSTLARVSSQPFVVLPLLLLLLLLINIFFPFDRRVGVLFFTLAAKREQNVRHGGRKEKRSRAQGGRARSVGAGRAKRVWFWFGANRA